MKTYSLVAVLIVLLAGCGLSARTEIDKLDPRFSGNAEKRIGIIKFDTYTIKPVSGQQVLGTQFGLIGALVALAVEGTKNKGDSSIEDVGVVLHMKALESLNARMASIPAVRFTDLKWSSDLDPVALSKYIQEVRMWGSKTPAGTDIAACSQKNQLDFVLYGKTWGGVYENSQQLYLATKWRIYDAQGNEAVSVFTQSVDEKPAAKLSTTDMTVKLIDLFNQNLDHFVSAIGSR